MKKQNSTTSFLVRNNFLLLIILSLVSGCGVVDFDKLSSSDGPEPLPKTTSGYPIVEGEYTVHGDRGTWQCTVDEQKQEIVILPEFSFKTNITQNDANLSFKPIDVQNQVNDLTFRIGDTVRDDFFFNKNGRFARFATSKVIIDGDPSSYEATVDFYFSGEFTSTGWSGTYQYIWHILGLKPLFVKSCSSSRLTFTGERTPLKA